MSILSASPLRSCSRVLYKGGTSSICPVFSPSYIRLFLHDTQLSDATICQLAGNTEAVLHHSYLFNRDDPAEIYSKMQVALPSSDVTTTQPNKKNKTRWNSNGLMAEREGFEPSRRYYRPTGIRSQTLQPLGYLSTASVILTHSRSLHNSKMLVFDDVEALKALSATLYCFLFLRALFLRSRTSPRSRIRAIRIPTIRVVRFET